MVTGTIGPRAEIHQLATPHEQLLCVKINISSSKQHFLGQLRGRVCSFHRDGSVESVHPLVTCCPDLVEMVKECEVNYPDERQYFGNYCGRVLATLLQSVQTVVIDKRGAVSLAVRR